ncbi:GNAT family N-acetyltransferase [Tsukamurella asaccharolytica]|uniref:GNAT family N-acetyltransferase n=1 Tax=Tsukamurella asaccharolytica TaxID=2592067 RepID=A0A5C5RBA6_9ACTN|nr:GNAT family N-acyltransferase [Tsukamurella asaccharolytica]TWS20220.1 GNAT family N-acetyltransferase [Tsukamurella asaccharolytica]
MTTRTPAGTVLFAATDRTPYTVFVAEDPRDIERAQALRYEAFSTELGAPLPGAVISERLGRPIDVDRFDDHSAHILVRHDPTDEIVGCYRVILPAPRGQREVFTTSMFRLSPAFDAMADGVAEWGRATIATAYRGGVVSVLLRIALLLFYERSGFRYAMGCMSVRMEDGVHPRAALVRAALGFLTDNEALASGEVRVDPIRPVSVDGVPIEDLPRPDGADEELVPPTIRLATRYGGVICGMPSYDPDFEMADFLVLFDAERMRRAGTLQEIRSFLAAL